MDRWPINPRRIVVFVGILVLILMVIDFNARLEELNLLKKRAVAISTEATQAVQTQMALQTQVAYAGSDQAVQDWARSEGHYVQPGDQPVVPVGKAGATPVQSTEPTPVPTPMPNWQIWWNLFFGDR
jgi:hypothetical protein